MTPNEAEEMLTKLTERHLPAGHSFSWTRDVHGQHYTLRVWGPEVAGFRVIPDVETYAIRNAPAAYRHNLVLAIKSLADYYRASATFLDEAVDRIARDEMAEENVDA